MFAVFPYYNPPDVGFLYVVRKVANFERYYRRHGKGHCTAVVETIRARKCGVRRIRLFPYVPEPRIEFRIGNLQFDVRSFRRRPVHVGVGSFQNAARRKLGAVLAVYGYVRYFGNFAVRDGNIFAVLIPNRARNLAFKNCVRSRKRAHKFIVFIVKRRRRGKRTGHNRACARNFKLNSVRRSRGRVRRSVVKPIINSAVKHTSSVARPNYGNFLCLCFVNFGEILSALRLVIFVVYLYFEYVSSRVYGQSFRKLSYRVAEAVALRVSRPIRQVCAVDVRHALQG